MKANFCNQCGKPLEEGEICSCQMEFQETAPPIRPEQPATRPQRNPKMEQAADATKALIGQIIPILKSPVEQLRAIAESGQSKLGLQMIGLNIVITFMLSVLAMVVMRMKLGDLAGYMKVPYATYAKTVLVATLLTAANCFATAGILFGLTKLFSKGADTPFAFTVTAVGGRALYDTITLILGAVCALLNGSLGAFVIVVGFILSFLIMVVSYCEIIETKGSTKVYLLAGTMTCVLILAVLAMNLFGDSMMSFLM